MRTTSTGSSMIASLDRKHYDYREQQEYQRKGTYLGYEVLAIPALSFPSCEDLLGSQARDERDSEINSYAFRNFAYGHINDSAAHSKPSGQQRHEYERVERKEKHLEDGIERDQSSAVVRVAVGEVIPYDHHRYAPCEADDDETGHVLGSVAKKNQRQSEHQDGADYPVLHHRKGEDFPVAKDVA